MILRYVDEIPIFIWGIIVIFLALGGIALNLVLICAVPLFLIIVIFIPKFLINARKSCLWGHEVETKGHGIYCKKCKKVIVAPEE